MHASAHSGGERATGRRPAAGAAGFTLLELLLAVSIMVVISGITYMAFSTVTTAWRRGVGLADEMHHADFLLEQVAMGLRSAYYPETGGGGDYGFVLKDDGDGPAAGDTIEWTKLGTALVGSQCTFAGTPHRVRFTVGDGEDGERAARVRAWPLLWQVEEFDPEDDAEEFVLPGGVTGFNCRPKDPRVTRAEEIEWTDEWEDTNRIPTVVELTLYMQPPQKGDDPVEVKRIVWIPVGPLTWKRMLPAQPPADGQPVATGQPGGGQTGTGQPAPGGQPAEQPRSEPRADQPPAGSGGAP